MPVPVSGEGSARAHSTGTLVRSGDSPRLALRQLVRYAEAGPPSRELSRAFVEFFGPDTEGRRGASGSSGALFMEWFLFDRPLASGETPARFYGLASPSLSPRQRRQFFELADTAPGFFEVVGFGNGGMWLLPFPDPSRQRPGEAADGAVWVEEPLASRRLSRGDIIWTRLLRWRSRWHLATCCFVLPPSARESLQPLARLRPRYSERAWRRLMGELQPQFFRDLIADVDDAEPLTGVDCLPLSSVERRYYLQLGAHLTQKGALRAALRLYWRVLCDDPRDVDARLGVAQVRWKQGRVPAAERALRSVLADEPDHLQGLLALGQLLLARGEGKEAARLLARYASLAQQPDPRALFGLGRLALAAGRLEEALQWFQRAVALQEQRDREVRRGGPAEPDAQGQGDPYGQLLVDIGWELASCGYAQQARPFFSSACSPARIRSVQASAWHGLGQSLERQGRHLQAATAYVQALRLGLDQPKLWAEVGRCYARAGRLQEAEAAYQASASRLPGYVKGLTGLAAVHLRQGMLDKALTEVRRAQSIDPKDPRALAVAGACWLRRGMAEKAARLLSRALAINPRDVNARRLLKMALAASGSGRKG